MFNRVLNTPQFNNCIGKEFLEFGKDIAVQDHYLFMPFLGNDSLPKNIFLDENTDVCIKVVLVFVALIIMRWLKSCHFGFYNLCTDYVKMVASMSNTFFIPIFCERFVGKTSMLFKKIRANPCYC